ncbi:hypothetical protein LEL_07006 [Akanthomyces lecanii RCEF 1005]|uniref:Transposase InsH N-terminal domain-containing protein n=1 Tax=Akanthomyces lecanii RCEF 1005 TaxID=1081108 RepID=A0A162KHJ6_CORDF|nr:hypothetical protein LEL_07006 [Akanthomyces lecanii RCEF 1005]
MASRSASPVVRLMILKVFVAQTSCVKQFERVDDVVDHRFFARFVQVGPDAVQRDPFDELDDREAVFQSACAAHLAKLQHREHGPWKSV